MKERRYRIAMVAACPLPYPRGTPIRIFRMAEALARRGNEVHVVAYHLGEPVGDLPFRLHRIREVPAYQKLSPGPTPRKLLQVDPLLAAKLRKFLRSVPVDVIHAHHYEGLLVSAAARAPARTPLVYDAHTLLHTELPYYSSALPAAVVSWLGLKLDRWLPRRADHVVAVTEGIRRWLRAEGGVPTERVTTIGNGVESEHFAVESAASGNDPTGTRTLMFAGNLAPYQGIDLLLRAFAAVVVVHGDARLQVVTDSSFEPYDALARELGVREQVEILRSDFAGLPRLLASADVLANPRTDCDGVPQKLLNYMAAGKPTVSFAGSAVGLEHGGTGLLVPDGDVEEFARRVLELFDDPPAARAMGERARSSVVEECSWERTAERVERVYAELLA